MERLRKGDYIEVLRTAKCMAPFAKGIAKVVSILEDGRIELEFLENLEEWKLRSGSPPWRTDHIQYFCDYSRMGREEREALCKVRCRFLDMTPPERCNLVTARPNKKRLALVLL